MEIINYFKYFGLILLIILIFILFGLMIYLNLKPIRKYKYLVNILKFDGNYSCLDAHLCDLKNFFNNNNLLKIKENRLFYDVWLYDISNWDYNWHTSFHWNELRFNNLKKDLKKLKYNILFLKFKVIK